MSDFMDKIIPLFITAMIFSGILQTILGKKQRQSKSSDPVDYEDEDYEDEDYEDEDYEDEDYEDEDYEDEDYEDEDYIPKSINHENNDDLAQKFELKLRKEKKAENNDDLKLDCYILPKKSSEADESERKFKDSVTIHYDGEQFVHDKGKVYYDPHGDYSYNEEKMNAEAAEFSARYAKKQKAERTVRVCLKHKKLVNGFVMSQILDKPRAYKQYGED